jgi:hypothetical protein
MPSIPLIDDAPASRANARPRGAFVLAALVLLFGHVTFAPSASAQRPPCIPSCDPMNPDDADCCPACVDSACQEFRDCQVDNRTAVEGCIDDCLGGVIQPGNCNFALNCSRRCAQLNIDCAKGLQENLEIDCGDCRIGRGGARRACNRCVDKEPPACQALLSDGTGSKCQKQCIRRTPWIGECYQRCADRCAKDRCAIGICRRGCRDSVCNNLANRCVDGSDIEYQRCCRTEDCSGDSIDTLVCESTTSTTSSTSSSSTAQPTTTTSNTVRTTTTRIGGGTTSTTL